jgi:hypothetical protein
MPASSQLPLPPQFCPGLLLVSLPAYAPAASLSPATARLLVAAVTLEAFVARLIEIILLLFLSQMSGLSELLVPADRTEYSSKSELVFALHDWAVKEKFSFRVAKSSGASWRCAQKECPWKVRGEVRKRWRIEGDGDEESEEEEDVNAEGNTDSEAEAEAEAEAEEQLGRRKRRSRTMTLVIVNGNHQCIGAAVLTHRSSSCQDWLDGAVTRHMKVTRDTTPK